LRVTSRGLGDVYKRQHFDKAFSNTHKFQRFELY
jgi:hypothetical protein